MNNIGDFIKHGLAFKEKKRTWGQLVEESKDSDDFMNLVASQYPRDFVLNHEKLEYYCKQKYKIKIAKYVSRFSSFANVPQSLVDWASINLNGRGDRPLSLFLVGASRLGKTEWARSLGTHTYFNSMFNLDDWNPMADYLVIDDIEWKYVPAKKALLGAQAQFTMTDKYRKKVTLTWGKPCIYLCNKDMDVYNSCEEAMWLRDNCVYVILHNKLY